MEQDAARRPRFADCTGVLVAGGAASRLGGIPMGLLRIGGEPSVARTLRLGSRNAAVPGVSAGAAGRWIVLAGAIVGGLVLAIVLIPDFASWTSSGAFHHHE